MKFIEEFVEQRSPEWLALHRGVITASRAIGLSTKARRATLAMTLAHESLSHEVAEQPVTDAMAAGVDAEPEIKARYNFLVDGSPRDIGFCWHPDYEGVAGCSPDQIDEENDRLAEFKRRVGIQIMRDMVEGPKPEDWWQVQFSLFVTGAACADYVDTAPHMQAPFDFCVTRIYPDEKIISKLGEYIEEVVEAKKNHIAVAHQRFGSGEIFEMRQH
jgi:hypothetical protein